MTEEPPNRIAVRVPAGCARGTTTLLRRAARAALERHGVRGAEISVAVVDDATIAELNQRHLDHPGPTDVLTFDLRDPLPGADRVCGEIVASLDTAEREALRRDHPTRVELALYVVHGMLHLLGYDDHTTAKSARMHRREDEILTSLGLEPAYGRRPRALPPGKRPADSRHGRNPRGAGARPRRQAGAQS